MKQFFVAGLFTLSLCSASTVVLALEVDVVPANQISTGATTAVDLSISGVDAAVTAIGGFDLTLAYNPAIVDFESASYGSALGNSGQVLTVTVPSSGKVELIESSLLSPSALAAEPASFTLVSLDFGNVAPGTSSLTLGSGTAGLVDAYANPLNFTAISGSVTVAAPVPLPPSLPLFTAAIAGMIALWVRPNFHRLRPPT